MRGTSTFYLEFKHFYINIRKEKKFIGTLQKLYSNINEGRKLRKEFSGSKINSNELVLPIYW